MLRKTAAIVVDIQGDFMSLRDGSLQVPGTDEAYHRLVAEAVQALRRAGCLIVATQDWHPQDHVSFYTTHGGRAPFEVIAIDGREQVLWPPHCVEDTDNADILVDGELLHAVVRKGSRRLHDSYSGFQDDGGHPTGLHDLLQSEGVERLIILGIATDYCVRATAMDAVALGYETVVPSSLCRGVAPDTTEEALRAMALAGVTIVEELDADTL